MAQSGPADRKAFADFVAAQVPEPYRKLVFQTRRGGEVSLIIEGIATAAFHGELAMPDSIGGCRATEGSFNEPQVRCSRFRVFRCPRG
jgi:hypothetical protein